MAAWLTLPALACAAAVGPLGGLPLLVLPLFALWFFRDPERVAPADASLLVSPADGRVLAAGPKTISIFLNVFDVHVCRTPLGGTVEDVGHFPGRFCAAWRDAAAEHNERVSILVGDGVRRVRFALVAGLVARRIVCRVGPGQRLRTGERVGLIRFGSRVDVSLPDGCTVTVVAGQRVVAGQTPIARLDGLR